MRYTVILLLGITLTLLVVLSLITKNPTGAYVVIDGRTFRVDVAKTDEQKTTGLDTYDKLPKERGMIFLFQTANIYPFWMKGMKFPIDIIYIRNSKIVDIFQNLPYPKNAYEKPATVTPKQKSNYVLEINAGLSAKYNFKIGDSVILKL